MAQEEAVKKRNNQLRGVFFSILDFNTARHFFLRFWSRLLAFRIFVFFLEFCIQWTPSEPVEVSPTVLVSVIEVIITNIIISVLPAKIRRSVALVVVSS